MKTWYQGCSDDRIPQELHYKSVLTSMISHKVLSNINWHDYTIFMFLQQDRQLFYQFSCFSIRFPTFHQSIHIFIKTISTLFLYHPFLTLIIIKKITNDNIKTKNHFFFV